jgi:hypothetical protein
VQKGSPIRLAGSGVSLNPPFQMTKAAALWVMKPKCRDYQQQLRQFSAVCSSFFIL